MKVIIVGGGIGGLALAIGLQGAGFSVQVHERTAAIEKLGSAIALWRNAL